MFVAPRSQIYRCQFGISINRCQFAVSINRCQFAVSINHKLCVYMTIGKYILKYNANDNYRIILIILIYSSIAECKDSLMPYIKSYNIPGKHYS